MKYSLPQLWRKLLKGDSPHRRSRFHTQDGQLAPLTAYARFPLALGQWIGLKLFDHYVERPWIPPSATRFIERRLTPTSRALEIGAGMSTLWLARRCKFLLSIEADKTWFDLLGAKLARLELRQVDLQFRWQREDMCDFSSIPDGSLHFCLIDGGPRLECIQAALPKLRPDGLMYVDNTDLYPDIKQLLLRLPGERPCRLTFKRGFAPACLFVNEGALLELSPSA